jgi:predicted XRE-type DNA-binding protein
MMGFPNEKELKTIRAKLAKAEPSRLLPKNASKADYVKYKLCEKFVIYLIDHKMSQVQLAKKLKVDPSRVNEIVKYRIDLYTVDKLMDLAERLDLDFGVEVA